MFARVVTLIRFTMLSNLHGSRQLRAHGCMFPAPTVHPLVIHLAVPSRYYWPVGTTTAQQNGSQHDAPKCTFSFTGTGAPFYIVEDEASRRTVRVGTSKASGGGASQ